MAGGEGLSLITPAEHVLRRFHADREVRAMDGRGGQAGV
jgi:hypothetical protein